MKFLKITNIYPPMGGNIDYKELNIDAFVPGSQLYPQDATYCLLATEQETIPDHPDITILSETEYINYKDQLLAELEATANQREITLNKLSEENDSLKQTAEAQSDAIAELSLMLSMLMMGGE